MVLVERGRGPAFVLVPGIQGRWEYLQPAIDELAHVFRVATFPLPGEPGSGVPVQTADRFDGFADQINDAIARLGVSRAILCGISFGGLIALRYAASHTDRVSALVLVSTPGPAWRLGTRHELYIRMPWLFGPVFFAEFPFRVGAELQQSIPSLPERLRFSRRQLSAAVRAPLSFSRMAERARLIGQATPSEDSARITTPTLIVTGEPKLDRVVPVEGTERYAALIPHARLVRLPRTGHLGYLTRPREFTDVVQRFLAEAGVKGEVARSRPQHDAA